MNMKQILQKKPEKRTNELIQDVEVFTKEIEFFKQLNSKSRNVRTQLHFQCCKYMGYAAKTKGSIVFNQGDPGDQLYIILDGSVSVLIKKDQLKLERLRQELINQRQLKLSLQRIRQLKEQQERELNQVQFVKRQSTFRLSTQIASRQRGSVITENIM